jgi:hypothetical protein
MSFVRGTFFQLDWQFSSSNPFTVLWLHWNRCLRTCLTARKEVWVLEGWCSQYNFCVNLNWVIGLSFMIFHIVVYAILSVLLEGGWHFERTVLESYVLSVSVRQPVCQRFILQTPDPFFSWLRSAASRRRVTKGEVSVCECEVLRLGSGWWWWPLLREGWASPTLVE